MNTSNEWSFHSPLRGLPLAECTVPALLQRQARIYGTKTLLQAGAVTRSFEQMPEAVAQTAGLLSAGGVRRGDRVAIMAGNRVELLDLILGCGWLGAVAVPLNTALKGDSLSHALTNSGARLLAAEAPYLERLDSFPQIDSLERVWNIDRDGDTCDTYPTEPMPEPPAPVAAGEVGPGDTFAILYTSGTTGVSKGVCCPHAQVYWWGVNVTEQLEITDRDTLFTTLPLFHTNALNAFFQALVAGSTYVLGERFSASRFWAELTDSGATVTYLLGAMVNILFSRPPGKHDQAHRARIALAPATPANLAEPFEQRFGIRLMDGFGATETNSVLAAHPREQRPGWLGRIRPDFEATVVDENDAAVPDGTPGELLLRSHQPYAFATGYFRMPGKTVEAWRNLWFHTGDRVVRDNDGWFRFVDRLKDVIRRRGENISSLEVENVISALPGIASVAVYALPSEMAEDEVAAAVTCLDRHITADDIIRHCHSRLPHFAIPRYVRFIPELPATENGKIRKGVLKEQGVTHDTWDRETSPSLIDR